MCFSYNTYEDYNLNRENNYVLNNINLKLPEGKFTALVGPSGGGKSTVARLITRFWDVSKGEIKIGGTNIKNFLCHSLLTQLVL